MTLVGKEFQIMKSLIKYIELYQHSTIYMFCFDFLLRPKGRRSNIALDLQFMQIFTNQKYS